jgi:hypothetical protein
MERAPVPNVQKPGWAPESFWSSVEKPKSLAHTEVQTPKRLTCRKSIYRLNYPGRFEVVKVKVKVTLEQATKAQRGSRCIRLLFL